ncbi:MAG: dihydrolipoamide acetyltransferase family protein [Steroidobacterales bacterium]
MSATVTANSIEIRAPSAQEEGTRSQVLRWLKAIGEPVSEHEPLIELETDKVTVEVASPAAGVLAEILKQEQEEVAPGELLGRIGPGKQAHEPSPQWTRDGADEARTRPRDDAARPVPALAPSGTAPLAARSPSPGSAAQQLSPAVRRLLAEHALDPSSVPGTGDGGRITVADVMREVSGPFSSARDSAPAASGSPALQPRGADAAADSCGDERAASHRVPHSAVRKRIAARMVESLLHTAPHVTTVFEVDMGEVLAHRQRQREEFARRGVALTLTAYFAQAAVAAIREVPEANSRWTETELEVYDSINLGIATAAAGGLVVPVLHAADSLDLLETARRLEVLVRRARDAALAPADVRGGTFTLSNHGVSGSLLAAPIIIPQPQSAILGLGKLEKRAVVIEEGGRDEIVVRPRCYATLTIDHRVMDGSRANRFLQAFTQRLAGWKD